MNNSINGITNIGNVNVKSAPITPTVKRVSTIPWANIRNSTASAFSTFSTWCANAWRHLLHIRINYTFFIAALLLLFLDQQGYLDSFPALQWAAGVELRLYNWFFDLLHSLCRWLIDLQWPSNGLLAEFAEWLKYIMLG